MNFIKCRLLLTASKLQPYYNAISEIRKTWEKDPMADSGFKSWPMPTPNQSYYRTPQHLFLEKITCSNIYIPTGPVIQNLRLFTPFGLVKILAGRSGKERHEIATNFLAHMNWDAVDVTGKIKVYFYDKEENKLYPQKSRKDEYGKITIHLVTRVGSIQLVPKDSDINKLDLVYYNWVWSEDKQDKQLFNTVSNGKNCF